MRFSLASFIIRSLFVTSILVSLFLLVTTSDRISSTRITDWIKSSTPFASYDGEDIYSAPFPRPMLMATAPLIEAVESDPQAYRFEWQQWLDLSIVDIWDVGNVDPAAYPRLSGVNSLDNLELPTNARLTQHEAALVGAYGLKDRLPAPARIIKLPAGSSDKSPGKAKVWNVKHSNESRNHKQFGHTAELEVNPTPVDWEALPNGKDGLDLIKTIHNEEFRWNPKQPFADSNERIMVQEALKRVRTSKKHYGEVNLDHDAHSVGDHYDWRFFRGAEEGYELSLTIQELARAWATLADAFGIDYWIAHGSVLGWQWNGLALPWDSDIDIQVPVQTLHRLAWQFNGSLVVPDPSQSNRTFLIDINPWYVDRVRGNGNNVIDARFIDTSSGSYIDITGLAYLSPAHTKVQCKNNHEYDVHEISPLMRTAFEGTRIYVPLHYESGLLKEYPKAEEPTYGKWEFNWLLRVWEYTNKDCEKAADDEYKIHNCHPVNMLADCDPEESDFGTCDEFVIEESLSVENYTLNHIREMSHWGNLMKMGLNSTNTTDTLAQLHDLLDTEYPTFHRLSALQ